MEIKQYAPVCIPTLNRYEHFKRCVESLSRCTHADKTELVIGLDYPPSEKYVEGYNLICNYLPLIKGFKKITIFKRQENFGASKNLQDLKDYAATVYDRYIASEDDNEFSPNFLDYINKGLEIYKDNPNVYAICGYNYPIDMAGYDHEYYFSHEFAAWGYGSWIDKLKKTEAIVKSPGYVMALYKNFPINYYFKNNLKLMSLASYVDQGYKGDVYITSYLHSRNVFNVFPKVSKVRNWGHDGSGVNCGKMGDQLKKTYIEQPIDTNSHFDYTSYLDMVVPAIINKRIVNFKRVPIKAQLRKILLFTLVRIYAKIQ